jgi:subtilisin family serine protease
LYDHLSLPKFVGDLEKRKRIARGGYHYPANRVKKDYYQEISKNAQEISRSFDELKVKYNGKINPHLIYRISVNQSVDYNNFVKSLHSMGGITVLSVSENKKGYWVVFSNDKEFKVFKDKLEQYSGIKDGNKYEFFNAIDTIEDIPVDEKIGPNLSSNPLKEGEVEYLDIELWRMEDEEINKFITELQNTYDWTKFRVSDQLITKSFALFRVKISNEILSEVVRFKEIARVERPFIPTFKLSDFYGQDISDFEISPPDDDSVGILVIDSGITSNHPLLEKAVGSEENFQDKEIEIQDKVGHGTAVAGVALYGDIKENIDKKKFHPSNWLFSAKVLYGQENILNKLEPVYDEEKLFESQLNNAIRSFLNNKNYRIKVVNISFGNRNDYLREKNNRQFPLAALLDELAYEYNDVVFVVSAGNFDPRKIFDSLEEIVDNYPNYLVINDEFRVINPATSALSITVGSIAQKVSILEVDERHKSEIYKAIAQENQPSPFTRTGFGINGMIKPEVVHYGGNLILHEFHGLLNENLGGKLPLLSNNPVDKLFSFDYGTSFSTPMVTNILGKIGNKFPDKSANYLKNLLLQSTDIFNNVEFDGSKSEKRNSLYKVLGYGLPNYEKAISSFDNRVVLLDEGVIGLNKVQVYSFNIPSLFFETKGNKKISVVLTFSPVTRMTRGDSYLGNRMEFKLYHSIDPSFVSERFAKYDFTEDEAVIKELEKYEIELLPGPNKRNSGCHQKGVKIYKKEPRNLPKSPFTLVIINSNKWINDEGHKQNYCVSVILEHTQNIKLYNEIRTAVQPRVRVR